MIWGSLDACYIAWYCVSSWRAGRRPYFSDLEATWHLLEQHGSASIAMVSLSWLLQLSVLVSCVLFLCQTRMARLLGLAQTPFRLCFLLPSIPLLLAAPLLPKLGMAVLGLVIFSEALKAWSLWRIA